MSKKDDALQMALDWYDSGNENPNDFANMIKQVIALAEQPAQQHIEHCIWARNGNAPCPHVQPAQPSKPLTDEQIDRAIVELGLNYLADAANNRAVLRELCRKAAHGIKENA